MRIGKSTVAAIGRTYGMLTVVGISHQSAEKRWVFLCHCACGGFVVRQKNNLDQGGEYQCCGCTINPAMKTHGMRSHDLYQTWSSMVGRCSNPNDTDFHNYGGRGITVCARWRDINAFIEDMSPKPDGTSLDRIDNNGNYSPDNCRWSTQTQQSNNMSRNVHITGRDGRTMTVSEWARVLGMRPATLHQRRFRGWSDDEVLYGR